ncbi:MAG: restriction endonuclease subunit S [Bacteroides cellulosilyticus]|jgi:restriction endonuclease S subunit|nr:restriction endonuclease subunit S [Bacteroides cellulosilyticus]
MAKQLYDYWFVQFDFPDENGRPYKSSGGEVVWNEKLKREIPEKWSDNTLEYFLNIKNGRDHKHLLCGSYPVYGSGGEMRRVCEWLYDGESVLMPRKGTLNNIMYVNEAFWTVDTMFYSVMKKEHRAKYIYYSIRDIDFTRWDAGTGVPSMTSSTLYSIPVIVPQENVLQAFDEKITPLFVAIKHNSKEISELTKQRDELLPLLMNGQVSVNYDLLHIIFFTLKVSCYNARNKYYSNGKGTDKDYFRSHQWVSEYRTK